jgi:hypothetical protein
MASRGQQTSAEGFSSDYKLESVLIESERTNKSIEANGSVSDLDIYEHLDKPYLTGTLTLIDTLNIYSQADILGAETVTIRIKTHREASKAIVKKFYVVKVIASQKASESSDLLVLHLIEDIAYQSNLLNVNQSFSGNAYDIIQKISNNFFEKDIALGNRTPKQLMKLIVPNMNPIESMIWVKNKAKTIEGLPFYLFSALANDKLWLIDLGTIIEEPVINTVPYRYGSIGTKSNDPNVKRRVIRSYTQKDIEDLYSIIQKGFIGGRFEYIDALTNRKQNFHHDIMSTPGLAGLIDAGIIQRNQPNITYSADYKLNEIPYNQIDSRRITRIGGTHAYRTSDDGDFLTSYGESHDIADYKLYVMADALDKLMKKVPMIIEVPGIDFLDGDKHSTIGCTIRLEFPISVPNISASTPQTDIKKSGDYMIFAARHKFKPGQYDLSLSCLKLANYKSQA